MAAFASTPGLPEATAVGARSAQTRHNRRSGFSSGLNEPARAAQLRRATGPAPIVFQLARALATVLGASTAGRPLAQTAERSPAPGARPATGACAREGRAIRSMQLPRMRQRSDRGMLQG